MKRSHAQSVGDIINEVLRQERLDVRLDEQRALSLWPELVGPYINRNTTDRHVKDGIITVTVMSAPLRNELMLSRSILIKKMNEALGRDIITDIHFR